MVSDPLVLTDPVTANRTVMPGVGSPAASSTVAVTQCSVETSLVAAGGESVSVAGAPGPKVSLVTNASSTPKLLLRVVSKAPAVVGKFAETVSPVT